ncbi:MAG TPA: PilZ domain-containing protein [Candidatus Acidoferrales bacterium]|nr:PilZ domain-containing protein [Candidatus Acidoferrales bacterium]
MTSQEAEKKRRYPRVELPKGMWVAWQDAGKRLASRVKILGMGGLFISIPDPPAVGTAVRLIFEVPSGEVRARAIVRSVKPGEGMGVEFKEMSVEDRARLQQLLKRLIG